MNRVACQMSGGRQVHSGDDLDNEMKSIQSTLFSGDLTGLNSLWYRLSADFAAGLVRIKACRTAAGRFFHVECTSCGEFVHVAFSHWDVQGPRCLEQARQRLFSWFYPAIEGAPEPGMLPER